MTIETPVQFLENFGSGFLGHVPVFAGGLQIGYANKASDFCLGKIVQSVKTSIPPSQWTTKGDFWEDISLTDYCAKHGVVPGWATVDAQGTVSAQEPSGKTVNLVRQADGSYSVPQVGLNQWLVIGGIAGVAVLLVILMARE